MNQLWTVSAKFPARQQLEIDINPTYTVIGNFPIVLRESLLPEIMRMGENVHKKARELAPPGIIGPFCLETVITDEAKIYTFEIQRASLQAQTLASERHLTLTSSTARTCTWADASPWNSKKQSSKNGCNIFSKSLLFTTFFS